MSSERPGATGPVEAANLAIDFLKSVERGLDRLDMEALRAAQDRQDAMAASRIARNALLRD